MPLSDPIKRASLLAEQAAATPADCELKLEAWAAVDDALEHLIDRTQQQAIDIFGSVRLQPLPVLAPVPSCINLVDQAVAAALPEAEDPPATGVPPLPAA